MLKLVRVVLKQVDRGLGSVKVDTFDSGQKRKWISQVEQYRDLTLKVIDQTERRVIRKESVPSSEKIVSLFEPHTDIIVKKFRDVQYGHKINLSRNLIVPRAALVPCSLAPRAIVFLNA